MHICMILDPGVCMHVRCIYMFLILIHVTMMHIPIMHLSMTLDPDACMYDAFINFPLLVIKGDNDACMYDAYIYDHDPMHECNLYP